MFNTFIFVNLDKRLSVTLLLVPILIYLTVSFLIHNRLYKTDTNTDPRAISAKCVYLFALGAVTILVVYLQKR